MEYRKTEGDQEMQQQIWPTNSIYFADRGGEGGLKILKVLWTSYMEAPLKKRRKIVGLTIRTLYLRTGREAPSLW